MADITGTIGIEEDGSISRTTRLVAELEARLAGLGQGIPSGGLLNTQSIRHDINEIKADLSGLVNTTRGMRIDIPIRFTMDSQSRGLLRAAMERRNAEYVSDWAVGNELRQFQLVNRNAVVPYRGGMPARIGGAIYGDEHRYDPKKPNWTWGSRDYYGGYYNGGGGALVPYRGGGGLIPWRTEGGANWSYGHGNRFTHRDMQFGVPAHKFNPAGTTEVGFPIEQFEPSTTKSIYSAFDEWKEWLAANKKKLQFGIKAITGLTDAAVGVTGIKTRYISNVAGAIGGLQPLNPFSYLSTDVAIRGAGAEAHQDIGAGLQGAGGSILGSSLAVGAINPVAGAVTAGVGGLMTLGGGLMNIQGMRKGADVAAYKGALSLIQNIGSALVTVIGGAFNLIKAGAGVILNLARSAVGTLTNLIGLGAKLTGGAAVAGAAVVATSLAKGINDPLEAGTGIDMRQRMEWTAYGQRRGISYDEIYQSQINRQTLASRFRTQGEFASQLPSALAGMISYQVTDSSFEQRVAAIQAAFGKAGKDSRRRNDLYSWLGQMGLGTEMKAALMNAQYGLGNANYYYKSAGNQANVESRRQLLAGEFAQIKTGIGSMKDDLANVLWDNPILGGYSGRQWTMAVGNIFGGMADTARSGSLSPLVGSVGNVLLMAAKTLDKVLVRLDKMIPNFKPYEMLREKAGGLKDWAVGGIGLIGKAAESGKSEDWAAVGRYVADGVGKALSGIGGFLGAAWNNLKPMFSGLFDAAVSGAKGLLTVFFSEDGFSGKILNFVADIGGTIEKTLNGMFEDDSLLGKAIQWGSAIIYNFMTAVRPAFVQLSELVSNVAEHIGKSIKFAITPGKEINPFTGEHTTSYKQHDAIKAIRKLEDIKTAGGNLGLSLFTKDYSGGILGSMDAVVNSSGIKWDKLTPDAKAAVNHSLDKIYNAARNGKLVKGGSYDEQEARAVELVKDYLGGGDNLFVGMYDEWRDVTKRRGLGEGSYLAENGFIRANVPSVPKPKTDAAKGGEEAYKAMLDAVKAIAKYFNDGEFGKALQAYQSGIDVRLKVDDSSSQMKIRREQMNDLFGAYGKVFLA